MAAPVGVCRGAMVGIWAWQRAAGAAALCLLAWAATPPAAAFGAPVDRWKPVDTGVAWSGPVVTPVPADAVAGCAGQRSKWEGAPGVVTLIVLRCTDDGFASGAVRAMLADASYGPVDGASPLLGAEFDIVVRSQAGDVERYWSQGTTYVGVGTSCRQRDCEAATARYERELSSLVGGAPNPLWPDPVAGALASFQPSGGPWLRVGNAVLPSTQLRVKDCAQALQLDWRAASGVAAMASVIDCGTPELAFRAWSDLWVGATSRQADGGVLGPGIDAAGTWDNGDGRVVLGRAWVQGSQYVYVHRVCQAVDVAQCGSGTAADARSIASLLPGELHPDTRGINLGLLALEMLILFPLGTTAVLLAVRAVWSRARDGGWSASPAPPGFQAVDRKVRGARLSRWGRTVVVAVVVAAGYVGGVLWTVTAGNTVAFAFWVFGGLLVLIPTVTGLVRLVWRPHPLARIARGPRGRATAGSLAGAAMRAGASGFAALALLAYGACAVLFLLVNSETPDLIARSIVSLLASTDPLTVAFGAVLNFVAELERRGLAPLLFLAVLAGPMTIAYLMHRLGSRLGQRSLPAVLAADTRPPILYLRGFEEDELRITPSLTRSGFLQWLTPFGRPRFEEVLVRYLSRFGPVIAVAGHQGRRLRELGAARTSFTGDEWQQRVHEWMADAFCVVIAATPAQVRDGLMWELVQLADDERRPRIALVTAPWPREELRSRWRGFLEATAGLPLFDGLARASFPDGLQVATWTSDAGWRGYGARRRWDWTYAASLVAAVEDAAAVWNRDRLAERGQPIEPDPLPTRAAPRRSSPKGR